MRSNCYFFAAYRWWTRGGYVVLRRSRYGWWPHALWSDDLSTFEDFTPDKAKYGRRLPPLLFTGRVRTFTPPEQD